MDKTEILTDLVYMKKNTAKGKISLVHTMPMYERLDQFTTV